MRESETDFSQVEIDNTLALLVDTQTWIQRRTDKVRLIDTYTVRRTIQFEIELPVWALEAAGSKDCRLILPVAVFGRGQALRNLEVTVGQEPAGTLTSRAGERLTRLLGERLRKNGDLGIPEATREFLDSLLGITLTGEPRDDPAAPGQHAARKVEEHNYILFVTSDRSIAATHGAAGSRFTLQIETDQTLVNELDRQPNVIARTLEAIGLESAARSTQLPANRDSEDQSEGRRGKISLLGGVLDFFRRTRDFLREDDTAFIVAQVISGFGDAGSWQLEVYAPDELRITDGAILWWPTPEPSDEGEQETGKIPASVGRGKAPPTRRASTAVALTRFRVAADSITHIGMLIAGASVLLLGVAVLIAAYGNTGPIVDAIVAILVIAPSLGSSIVTNPDSHEMAGSYLRPHRKWIYAIGVVSAIGAGLFIIYGLLSLEVVETACAEETEGERPGASRECIADRGPFKAFDDVWNGALGLEGFAIAALFSFFLLLATWALLGWIFLKLDRLNQDVEDRKRRSRELLPSEGPDLSLRAFVESTSDWTGGVNRKERARAGLPLMTLSADAIDIGPRAIFRLPKATAEPTRERRLDGREKFSDSPTRDRGLWRRFTNVPFRGATPPEWFFWAGDIEADFSADAGFSEAQILERLDPGEIPEMSDQPGESGAVPGGDQT